MKGCKLSAVGLGMACGLLWGLSILAMGLIDYAYAYGHAFVTTVGSLYLVYEPTIRGSFLGGIIAFFNAFITGFLIAWLYNLFNCCGCFCCNKNAVCVPEEPRVKKTTRKSVKE